MMSGLLASILSSGCALAGGVGIVGSSAFGISPGGSSPSKVTVVNDAEDLTGDVVVEISYDGPCGPGRPGAEALSLTLTDRDGKKTMVGRDGRFIASGVRIIRGSNDWRIDTLADPRICPGTYSAEVGFEGRKTVDVPEITENDAAVADSGASAPSAPSVVSFKGELAAASDVPEGSPDIPDLSGASPMSDLSGSDIVGGGPIASAMTGMKNIVSAAPFGSESALGRIGEAVRGKLPVAVSSAALSALAVAGLRRRYVKMKRDLIS